MHYIFLAIYHFSYTTIGEITPPVATIPENVVEAENTLHKSDERVQVEADKTQTEKEVKEEVDTAYVELERKLGLSDGLKQYFSVLWTEGFTTPELLSEVTVDDLKELSILLLIFMY